MPQHSAILSADCHEPKHITNATTADAGKVITPSSSTDGVSEFRSLVPSEVGVVSAYGGKTVTANATATSITAAVDSTFATASDYVQITGIYDSPAVGPVSNITENTNDIAIQISGVYKLDFWAGLKSSVNSNQVALNFGINGVVQTTRSAIVRTPNNTDPFLIASHGLVSLTAGQLVTLHAAALLTSDITFIDGRLTATLIEAA